MITIIFGAPGSGKSSLSTYFLKTVYRREGKRRMEQSRELILRANAGRETPLTVPSAPPIFSNYRVRFKTGYEKWFEPYFVNGYYLGLPNDKMPTQFIPPASAVFLGEAQRFFNSRSNARIPDWVSRFFEMHRHYRVDVWMDVQRPILIDANIRELCKRFIEVREMAHDRDDAGRIVKTVFRCREFDRWGAVEQYLSAGAGGYRETEYVHDGNIFRSFDSYSYFDDFLPKAGNDFKMLPFRGEQEGDEIFYKTDEPRGYRGKGNGNGKNGGADQTAQ